MRLEPIINPRRIGLILGLIALYLTAQSLFNEFLLETFGLSNSGSLLAVILDLFSVNLEESIPTWFSTVIIFIAAGLVALIAMFKRASDDRYARHWLWLSVIFLYLSMDEGAAIHEILADPLQQAFNTRGYLTFGWQIVAVPLVIIFGLLYFRFLLHLPPRTRNLFVLAASLYAGGALIVEGISANQWALGGGVTLPYLTIATIEECFEMLGVVIFIYALLAYIVEKGFVVTFRPPLQASQRIDNSALPAPAKADGIFHTGIPLRYALLLVVIIAAVNVTFFSLARAQQPTTIPETLAENSTFTYQQIIDDLTTDQTVVARTAGVFSADNLISRQIAVSLLDLFDDVMVISLPEADLSIMIAGNPLTFDRNSLTEILQANGETQFIIFETPIVSAIAGDALSPASD